MTSTQPIMRCGLADQIKNTQSHLQEIYLRGQRCLVLLELELQVMVYCLTWVLGIKLRLSSKSSMKN